MSNSIDVNSTITDTDELCKLALLLHIMTLSKQSHYNHNILHDILKQCVNTIIKQHNANQHTTYINEFCSELNNQFNFKHLYDNNKQYNNNDIIVIIKNILNNLVDISKINIACNNVLQCTCTTTDKYKSLYTNSHEREVAFEQAGISHISNDVSNLTNSDKIVLNEHVNNNITTQCIDEDTVSVIKDNTRQFHNLIAPVTIHQTNHPNRLLLPPCINAHGLLAKQDISDNTALGQLSSVIDTVSHLDEMYGNNNDTLLSTYLLHSWQFQHVPIAICAYKYSNDLRFVNVNINDDDNDNPANAVLQHMFYKEDNNFTPITYLQTTETIQANQLISIQRSDQIKLQYYKLLLIQHTVYIEQSDRMIEYLKNWLVQHNCQYAQLNNIKHCIYTDLVYYPNLSNNQLMHKLYNSILNSDNSTQHTQSNNHTSAVDHGLACNSNNAMIDSATLPTLERDDNQLTQSDNNDISPNTHNNVSVDELSSSTTEQIPIQISEDHDDIQLINLYLFHGQTIHLLFYIVSYNELIATYYHV